jgi:hypothetical protein
LIEQKKRGLQEAGWFGNGRPRHCRDGYQSRLGANFKAASPADRRRHISKNIGMAYVHPALGTGQEIQIEIREMGAGAVVALPFYKRPK